MIHSDLTTRLQLRSRRLHERAPPRAATTPPKSCSTPLSASKGAIFTRTRPANCVERPVSYNTTPLLLTTRLQLRSGRRHERAPPRVATTPPKWCSTPLGASKRAILTRTRPGNCVERPISYNTTPFLLTTRLQLRPGRRHERAPPRAATTPPKWCSTPMSEPKIFILTRTRLRNCVKRPVSYNTTPLLLTTRLQLRSRRRHERAPPRAATMPPKSCSAPLSASKGVVSMCTHPGNWEGRLVSYNTTQLLRTRLQLRSRRRHERPPPRAVTTPPT